MECTRLPSPTSESYARTAMVLHSRAGFTLDAARVRLFAEVRHHVAEDRIFANRNAFRPLVIGIRF